MKKIIIIALSLSIILGFLFWRFGPNITGMFSQKTETGPISLTFWGLWEDEALIKPVIDEYKKQNPNISVSYVRQSSINYRTRVQTQVREGVGPDVFMIHNSWLPMFTIDIQAAPEDVLTLSEYKSLFYPVAEESFVKNGQIFAASSGIDGLALFVNEDILGPVGGQIPKNWQEFRDYGIKMTTRDQLGIKTAGAAMGATANVDHWSDILGILLLQQPGVDLSNPATSYVAEVIKFYTDFVIDPSRKTWDTNLPSSTQMFAQGRLGFYFAPSWRAHELRLMNPNLKFKVVAIPQLSSQKTVNWATFWGLAVSKQSKFPKESWQFLKFLTSAEAEKIAYQEAAKIRLFGQPYSRIDLAKDLADDPIVGAFVTQGPNYKFWYLASDTFDNNGINEEMIKYFEDGINATLAGTNPQIALQTVAQGVKQVLDKYNRQPTASPTN